MEYLDNGIAIDSFYQKGYLKGYAQGMVEVDDYNLEFLFRVDDDPQNGEALKMVSIDYLDRHFDSDKEREKFFGMVEQTLVDHYRPIRIRRQMRKSINVAWILNRDKGAKMLEHAIQDAVEKTMENCTGQTMNWWQYADVDIFSMLILGINDKTKEKIIGQIVEHAV